MLQKEQWMQIHVLKAQGVSEREIARRLGISQHGGAVPVGRGSAALQAA